MACVIRIARPHAASIVAPPALGALTPDVLFHDYLPCQNSRDSFMHSFRICYSGLERWLKSLGKKKKKSTLPEEPEFNS